MTADAEKIENFVLRGLASPTEKMYRKEYEKYLNWRKQLILERDEPELLSLYLMTVAKESRAKTATIMAAVSFFEKRKSTPPLNPHVASTSPFLGLVKNAITKNAPPVKHKEQVTGEELLRFLPLAKSQDLKESRMGTLVFTLFAGFLRPMELLSMEKKDVIFEKSKMSLTISKSKCNQKGPPERIYVTRLNTEQCPVSLLENWIQKCPKSPFLFPSLSGLDRPWSYDAALSNLKKTTKDLKIDKALTLHSFRGSAATAAINAGCSEAELDRGCRWKSASSKKSYVQRSAASTKNVSSLLGNLMDEA